MAKEPNALALLDVTAMVIVARLLPAAHGPDLQPGDALHTAVQAQLTDAVTHLHHPADLVRLLLSAALLHGTTNQPVDQVVGPDQDATFLLSRSG